MPEKILSLDLGSRLLKVVLTEVDEKGEVHLLTQSTREVSSFKNGEIIDEELFGSEVGSYLFETLNQFEAKNLKIILSLSSSTFSFQKIKTKSLVEERYVSENDLRKCFSLARASIFSTSNEIIYEEPSKFFLDNSTTGIRNPLGLEARYLEVEINVIQIFKPFLVRLRELLKTFHIIPQVFYPNPLGASMIVLDQKTKEDGCLLLDMGYETSSFLFYFEGTINNLVVFNFGLKDLISDLLSENKLSSSDFWSFLEEVKNSPVKKQISLKGKRKISLKELTKSFSRKLNHLFKKHEVFNLLTKQKEKQSFLGGSYLIGGAIFLPEIEALLKNLLKLPFEKAHDPKERLNDNDLIFANALGNVYLYLKTFQEPRGFFEEIIEHFKNFFSNIWPF